MKQIIVIACIAFAFCSTLSAQSSIVRVQSVPIPFDSGLMTDLLTAAIRALKRRHLRFRAFANHCEESLHRARSDNEGIGLAGPAGFHRVQLRYS